MGSCAKEMLKAQVLLSKRLQRVFYKKFGNIGGLVFETSNRLVAHASFKGKVEWKSLALLAS